jgi:hypothetical protein
LNLFLLNNILPFGLGQRQRRPPPPPPPRAAAGGPVCDVGRCVEAAAAAAVTII